MSFYTRVSKNMIPHTCGTSMMYTTGTYKLNNTYISIYDRQYVPVVYIILVPHVCGIIFLLTPVQKDISALQQSRQNLRATSESISSSILANIAIFSQIWLYFRKILKNSQKSRFFNFFFKLQLALKIELDVVWKRYRARWKAKGQYFRVCKTIISSQVSAHMWHTAGTSSDFVAICCFLLPSVPHVCNQSVPDVCAYFFDKTILKYKARVFQRRVSSLSTTKTRFCSSI